MVANRQIPAAASAKQFNPATQPLNNRVVVADG
jgi:hypothetical protein